MISGNGVTDKGESFATADALRRSDTPGFGLLRAPAQICPADSQIDKEVKKERREGLGNAFFRARESRGRWTTVELLESLPCPPPPDLLIFSRSLPSETRTAVELPPLTVLLLQLILLLLVMTMMTKVFASSQLGQSFNTLIDLVPQSGIRNG
nr:hypothetical protein Iba_chr01aCG7110 [Ipomoea batatas]